MNIRLNPSSGQPIYLQIAEQVTLLVASGHLKEGDAMPAIRTLAEKLLVNPNTVARAYRELEAAGVVLSRVGSGTVVAGGLSPLAKRERLRRLEEQIDRLLAQARQLNFSLDEVKEELDARARSWQMGKGDGHESGEE